MMDGGTSAAVAPVPGAGLEAIIRKSVAVCSGKGGVGKTVIAANLAIYCARRGLRVGLVDLDPLSDIATILDLLDSEQVLAQTPSRGGVAVFAEQRRPVFRNLDLLFPAPKLERERSAWLREALYRSFAPELDDRYDLLIFDMPAGSGYEDNLVFLPFMRFLVLVTNPEPTAHASAGGYLRKALELYPGRSIHLWHNRFSRAAKPGFDPLDVTGNYNRNVPEEERLKPAEASRLVDFAFVPEDASLNLLRGNPGVVENILRSMGDLLESMQEEALAGIPIGLPLSERTLELVRFFVSRSREPGSREEGLAALGEYLRGMIAGRLGAEEKAEGIEFFSPEERRRLLEYLERVKQNQLRQHLLRVLRLLEERLEELAKARSPFAAPGPAAADKALDREITSLLILLKRKPSANRALSNRASLLLFYFSLAKLFQSKTLTSLLLNFIPKKRNSRGQAVRDRHKQIRILVEGRQEDREMFLVLIRTLFPIVSRQIMTLVKTFELSNLLFRTGGGEINKKAYLKLFTHFVHDIVYSGLGVVVGFEYRRAAAAFQEGAEKLLASLKSRD